MRGLYFFRREKSAGPRSNPALKPNRLSNRSAYFDSMVVSILWREEETVKGNTDRGWIRWLTGRQSEREDNKMSNLQENIPELYRLFTEVYRPRMDIVGVFYSGKSAGLMPLCDNEYTNICPKSFNNPIGCGDCDDRRFAPLTEELFSQHVKGQRKLGMYPLLPDHTCWFIALDFDDHKDKKDPYMDTLRLLEVLKAHGFGYGVCRSKSGKGYHVTVHFKEAVPAWKARSVMQHFLDKARLNKNSSYCSMYPKSDELNTPKMIGNAISIPFQGQAMNNKHTLLLDPETEYLMAYTDQFYALKIIMKHSESDLDKIISEYMCHDKNNKSKISSVKNDCGFILPETIPEGKRNSILLRYASSMQAKGYSDEDIEKYMFQANETRCQPPESLNIVNRIIKYVLRFEKGNASKGNVKYIDKKEEQSDVQMRIKEVYEDAPVSADALCPAMFSLNRDGIYILRGTGKKKTWELVLNHPVVITKRLKNISDGTEMVEIGWFRDQKWHTRVVTRECIADGRQILGLCNYGMQVNDINKKDLVKYLYDYEVENEKWLPMPKICNTLGWQNDYRCFVYGESLITADRIIDTNGLGDVDESENLTYFNMADEGNRQIALGYHEKGSFEKWVEITNEVLAYDYATALTLAAFAPPFMFLLKCSNFVIEIVGETSRGKTTQLRHTGSIWGCPDEREKYAVLYTWDVTPVWLERAAVIMNGIPVILDDTKKATTKAGMKDAKEFVRSTIYAFTSGKGRGRGKLEGIRNTDTFRSALISSGEEQSAGRDNPHGGANARILSLWGSVYGDGHNKELVDSINKTVMDNYGFAGKKVVQYILQHRGQWDQWRDEFTGVKDHYADLVGKDTVAGRLSEYIAVLELVGRRVQEALPELEFQPIREVLARVQNEAVTEKREAFDPNRTALVNIWNWIVANEQKFFGRHKEYGGQPAEPHGGWFGRWDRGSWDKVSIIGKVLRDELGRYGHDSDAVTRVWAERGWLIKGRYSNQVTERISGNPVSCYKIRRDALEKEFGYSFDGDDGLVVVEPELYRDYRQASKPCMQADEQQNQIGDDDSTSDEQSFENSLFF